MVVAKLGLASVKFSNFRKQLWLSHYMLLFTFMDNSWRCLLWQENRLAWENNNEPLSWLLPQPLLGPTCQWSACQRNLHGKLKLLRLGGFKAVLCSYLSDAESISGSCLRPANVQLCQSKQACCDEVHQTMWSTWRAIACLHERVSTWHNPGWT